MSKNPYLRFENSDLILRDELAIDRTILANERTLLAYLRSAVALLIAGISIIHFSSEKWFMVFGFTCIPAAFLTAWVGLYRFRKMSQSITIVRKVCKSEEGDIPSVTKAAARSEEKPHLPPGEQKGDRWRD